MDLTREELCEVMLVEQCIPMREETDSVDDSSSSNDAEGPFQALHARKESSKMESDDFDRSEDESEG